MKKWKRALTALLAVAFLLTCIFSASVGVRAESQSMAEDGEEEDEDIVVVQVDTYYDQSAAREMLDYINKFRAGKDVDGQKTNYVNEDGSVTDLTGKLDPLVYDYDLEKVAMQRALECALRFGHERPNGETCFTAWEEAGIVAGSWAENLAGGYDSARDAFVGFREDDQDYNGQGHRRAMLSSSSSRIGIGHVVMNGMHYWAQAFGSEDSGGEETKAFVGNKTVKVEINTGLESLIGAYGLYNPPEYRMIVGDTEELPECRLKFCFSETFPPYTILEGKIEQDWEIEEEDVAYINGKGKIVANGVGTTLITAESGGEILEIPILVTIFRDVIPGDWYYDDVMKIYETSNAAGTLLMSGYKDGSGKFGATDPLTRQDFAVILYRLAEEPTVSKGSNPFPDAKTNGYYYDSILWAKNNKVITGYENKKFGVGDNITREQVATILFRYARDYMGIDVSEAQSAANLKKFNDFQSISTFAKDALAWANGAGIITGKKDGRIDPQGNAARAEIATMILRFLKYVNGQSK